MANYATLMRRRPEVREFVRNRKWVHRGEAVAYAPNIRCDVFTTDAAGFRHSVFRGETVGLREILAGPRYGLVMGPSNVFGFGLAGNELTMPSVLGEMTGFPWANISLPEGNSRNLYGILLHLMTRAERPPTAVIHISGGDYTNFCYTSLADPVFGPPNLFEMQAALDERGGRPPAESQIGFLLTFTTMWMRQIIKLCRSNRVPLVLGHDTTFFEKRVPSEIEIACELGKAFAPGQAAQFATHVQCMPAYSGRREALAAELDVVLAGPGPINDLGFIDEFHYDRDGTRSLCTDFAAGVERALDQPRQRA